MVIEAVSIALVFGGMVVLGALVAAASYNDHVDLRRRQKLAKERREESRRAAQELYIAICAEQRAQEIVAEQLRDTSPVSVTVTRNEYLQRRRIMRPENP